MQEVQLLGKLMTTMGVKLDDGIRMHLKTLSERRDRTPHWLMKKAIIDFLDQKESLEKRNLEADAALRDYQVSLSVITRWKNGLIHGVQTRKVHVQD